MPDFKSTRLFSAVANFTAAAAAYGAADVMDTAKEFVNIGPAGGGEVTLTSVSLQIAHTAIISGETSYLLYLYNVTPPSAPADNALFDIPSGDRAALVAKVNLGTPVDEGSTLLIQTDSVNKQLTVPASGSLWGLLVTVGAFTATAAIRKVTLHTSTK